MNFLKEFLANLALFTFGTVLMIGAVGLVGGLFLGAAALMEISPWMVIPLVAGVIVIMALLATIFDL